MTDHCPSWRVQRKLHSSLLRSKNTVLPFHNLLLIDGIQAHRKKKKTIPLSSVGVKHWLSSIGRIRPSQSDFKEGSQQDGNHCVSFITNTMNQQLRVVPMLL